MARGKGWRFVKKHVNYSIHEAARNQQVAKGTVQRWIKQGLPCLKDTRPHLIIGHDLIDFLKEQSPKKHPLQSSEFFCFSCKAARKPAFNEVEFTRTKQTGGKLQALCSECTTVMHKCASLTTLEALRPILKVSFMQGQETLSDETTPLCNDTFRKD